MRHNKFCRSCGHVVDKRCFNIHTSRPDGLNDNCKPCRKTIRANIYQTSARVREQIRARARVALAASPGLQQRYNREWYAANKAKHLAKSKIYREQNRARMIEHGRAYYAARRDEICKRRRENKELGRQFKHTRRARMRNAQYVKLSPTQIAHRASVFGSACAYCSTGAWEHDDHVKPIARGGPHILANIRPSCRRCNLSKNARCHNVWLAGRPHVVPLPLP